MQDQCGFGTPLAEMGKDKKKHSRRDSSSDEEDRQEKKKRTEKEGRIERSARQGGSKREE